MVNLGPVRRLVQALLAAWGEFEMFDCIGQPDLGGVDAGQGHGLPQHLPRRSDERAPFQIFAITRLLAHDHQRGIGCTFAPNGLRGGFTQATATASGGRQLRIMQRGGQVRHLRHRIAIAGRNDCRPRTRRRAARIAHPLHPRLGIFQHFGDQPGFGQVLPVFLGHLGPHRIQFDARGIEDIGKIGGP